MIRGSYADTPSDLMIGRGKMYFNRLIDGTPVGSRYLGNGELFESDVQDEIKEKYSSSEASSGLLQATNIRRKFEGSISLDEYSDHNIELAFMGTGAVDSQDAADVEDEEHTVVLGAWDDLGDGTVRQVDTVLVTNEAGDTTYDEHDDYEVDPVGARIWWNPDGAIADASTVKVTYHVNEHAGFAVDAGVSNVIEGEFLFIGDPANGGPKLRIRAWKVQLQPDGGTGLISDDYGAMKFKFKAVKDSKNHPTTPFMRVDRIG